MKQFKLILLVLFATPAFSEDKTAVDPIPMTTRGIKGLMEMKPDLMQYLTEESKAKLQHNLDLLEQAKMIFENAPKSYGVKLEEDLDYDEHDNFIIDKAKAAAVQKCIDSQIYPFCCVSYRGTQPQGDIRPYHATVYKGSGRKKSTSTVTKYKATATAVAIGYFDSMPDQCR